MIKQEQETTLLHALDPEAFMTCEWFHSYAGPASQTKFDLSGVRSI